MFFFRPFIRGTILDFSKRQNAVFWISQIAIIVSTVLGVYLAASEGLKSAVEFHAATNLEKKYFTLNSLRREVDSNSILIIEFSEKNLVKDKDGKFTAHRSYHPPPLNWFVWTTMSKMSLSLELPVDILRDVDKYFNELTQLTKKYRTSGGRAKLIIAEKLYKLSIAAQEEMIVRIDLQIAAYKVRLEPYDTLGTY